MQGDPYRCHCWMLDSRSKTEKGELVFFNNYFESKKDLAAFPFTIFCDHVPENYELEDILYTKNIYQKKVKLYILVLKKKISMILPGAGIYYQWELMI